MAIVTRVPLGFPTPRPSFSSSLSKSSQCHKHRHSLVALSTTSIRVPETSTLFSPYIILSNSPFLQKRDTKGFRRVKVVSAAMADLAPSTVLVTGAGGRTGLIPSLSFSLFFFLSVGGVLVDLLKGLIVWIIHVKNGGALCLSGCNNYIKFGGLNGLPLAIRVYVQLHYIVLFYFIPSSHACILNNLTL